jgi:hypothetical protein
MADSNLGGDVPCRGRNDKVFALHLEDLISFRQNAARDATIYVLSLAMLFMVAHESDDFEQLLQVISLPAST